jgi:hypothetical protein
MNTPFKQHPWIRDAIQYVAFLALTFLAIAMMVSGPSNTSATQASPDPIGQR